MAHLTGKNRPASQSEKTDEFSTLYISVRKRRVDEFSHSGWLPIGLGWAFADEVSQDGGLLTTVTR